MPLFKIQVARRNCEDVNDFPVRGYSILFEDNLKVAMDMSQEISEYNFPYCEDKILDKKDSDLIGKYLTGELNPLDNWANKTFNMYEYFKKIKTVPPIIGITAEELKGKKYNPIIKLMKLLCNLERNYLKTKAKIKPLCLEAEILTD